MSVSPSLFTPFKRSNGVYYISYYLNGRGRWKSSHAGTRPEALDQTRQWNPLQIS